MTDRELMQMASNALKNCRLLIYKWSDFAHDSLKKEEELASDIASLSLAIQFLGDRLADHTRSEKLREAGYTRRPKAWKEDEPDLVDWQGVAADQAMTIAMMKMEQKHEWVGLRDEDLPEGETYDFDRGVRWAETKLKEKNT
jgi:hypothetical protein